MAEISPNHISVKALKRGRLEGKELLTDKDKGSIRIKVRVGGRAIIKGSRGRWRDMVVLVAPCSSKPSSYFDFKAKWIRGFPVESGSFLVDDLFPGDYKVKVNYRNRIGELAVRLPPSTGKGVPLEIPKCRRVSCFVHGKDGRGIGGIDVYLQPFKCPGPFLAVGPLESFGPAKERAIGVFSFDGVGEETYYLVVKNKKGEVIFRKKVKIHKEEESFDLRVEKGVGHRE